MRFLTSVVMPTCLVSFLGVPLISVAKPTEHIDVTIVLSAVKDCQPECAVKQFDDFKNNLDDYFDQHSGCEEKFAVNLKQRKHTLKQWYSRECVIQCMNVVRQEFADYEDVKGQIGSGSFAFWASKGAVTAAGKICEKGS